MDTAAMQWLLAYDTCRRHLRQSGCSNLASQRMTHRRHGTECSTIQVLLCTPYSTRHVLENFAEYYEYKYYTYIVQDRPPIPPSDMDSYRPHGLTVM